MKNVFMVLTCGLLIGFLSAPAFGGRYSSDFDLYLEDHQAEEMIGAVITMADQVDLDALKKELYARRADRREWHEGVVLALQDKATVSQAGIISRLAGLANRGLVKDYRGLWIGNVVLVTATREALDILVQRDDVLQIDPDYEIENIEPVSKGDDSPPLIAGVEAGLGAIRADEVWDMGYTGAGRLVSHLDTGVDGTHPALNARWRGYDPRYAENPEWAWFDPITNTEFPQEWNWSHGTHTMGTICGLGESTGDTIGVAFGAEWISAGVIDRIDIPRTISDAILSFQWIADPDEDPFTVWDVPDVCSNSWGISEIYHGYDYCDPMFWEVLDGCEAAGVFVVFAAGNEGPGQRTLRNPATRATTDIQSFAVGALDGNNPNFPIAYFSSRGPSECTPDGRNALKPEVSAPGVDVRSSVPGGGYQGGWDGTSMACPHVAGVVALMREANPNLTTDQIGEILLETAFDLGEEGEDNAYGMGIVDAYEAVTLALAYLEGWGALAGYITDQASGDPIEGATVSVIDRGWSATSNGIGYYRLFIPSDTLWDIRVENPPTHLPLFDQQEVAEGETLIVNYALEGKVIVTLKASFANPEDASYRAFYIKGSWDNDGFYDPSWSGDYIAIYDDGVAPDEVAEDGVFTGTVMLARDEVNTYGWAVYSENYGGEGARLDAGADFDIPDLNPPDVPVLVVNPSGSDNNWIISVEGDNGLSLDLMQGIDNTPTKWGAATALSEGVTYTFRFHVMHSDVASYGSGGIGGPDLTYTPTVEGSYDFIFDDLDDSYIVQMTGTEGPPINLTAVSGLDHHIPLSWQPPERIAPPPDSPISMDIQVLAGYNLYRDTAARPYDSGMRINAELITEISYDDWGDDSYGPIINGVTYYYQASAVYDIGGGEFVEVGPSNLASAMAVNHPPVAPFLAEPEVLDFEVNLTWTFEDPIGDFDHFAVYRKFMPSGEWELIGSTVDASYTDIIADGQDGVYGYRVTAFDDGVPPLESAPSNVVYASVGHLPPVNLMATSDQDAHVPLRWSLPGSWRVPPPPDDPEPPLARELKDRSSIAPGAPGELQHLNLSHKGDDGPVNPPVILDQGGPDEFGYSWIDSDEPGGPAYSWRDIVGIGEQIPITYDDQNLGPFDIGFDFSFYDGIFSTFNICSNGWISFTNTQTNYLNQPIPDPDVMENLVAPFWDDLYPPGGGEFWYYSDGFELVISFIGLPHYSTGGPYTFQIILRQTGAIIFQYQEMLPPLNSSTIGIQNGDGSIGLQIVYNAEYIHDELAIRIATGPEGLPPVHYNLYRSETSPVPVDPAYLITSSIPGDMTNHIDSSNVENGVTYYYVMTAVWPDSVESPPSNEASATPVLGARMVLDPTSFTVAASQCEIVTENLNIANPGGLDLDFTIMAETDDRILRIPDNPYFNRGKKEKFSRYSAEYDKSNPREEETYPSVILDRGGPDEFGYVWIDSDEPCGPTFEWIDLTHIGDPISMYDDDNQGPFEMAFDFPFYGRIFNSIRICSNGFLSFTSTSTDYSNDPIPGSSAPENLIAPFWEDIAPDDGGMIYFYTDETMTAFSWVDVPAYDWDGETGPFTFEVILYPSGAIKYQYLEMYPPLESATIGIQDSTRTIGLQIAFNQLYVHDELAVMITNSWLSAEPISGTVGVGDDMDIDVIFDATFIDEGTHTGQLIVTGYDMNHMVDQIIVPCTFIIGPTAVDGEEIDLPAEFILSQNYPNPFNPATEIKFALPENTHVKIEIFNVLGQKVRTLVDADMDAGYKSIVWNGTDGNGQIVSSGVYLYRMQAGDKMFTKKMLMLK